MTETHTYTIQTRQLRRDFAADTALRDVTLQLEPGQVCALLGKNGAGKTTLLKLLMGLIQPTAGEYHVLGTQWSPESQSRVRIGCLLDRFEPSGSTRIRQLLDVSEAAGPQFDRARATELLKSHQLNPNRYWSTLSKGQRRWTLLSLLLCRKCDVLLLDEPADGLDPQSRLELYQLIRQQANDYNTTALIATHIITDIERIADQICILHDKTIRLQADLEELRDQVFMVERDGVDPQIRIPAGIELLHTETTDISRYWLRDRDAVLSEELLNGEVRRRRCSLEELYLALTKTADTQQRDPVSGTESRGELLSKA